MRRSDVAAATHGSAGSSHEVISLSAAVSEYHEVRVLEAAYLEERHRGDQLEKKYARLKRRFLRLERAHAKLLVATHEAAHRSPPPQHQQLIHHEERSPARSGHSSLDADVIDLTGSSTRSPALADARAGSSSRMSTARRVALADDFCAESPDSTRGDDADDSDAVDEFRRPVSESERSSRRTELGFLQEQRPTTRQPSRYEVQTLDEIDDSDSGFRVMGIAPARAADVTRPRPRLGVIDSLERRIRREPEQDRDYEFGRRRRTVALTHAAASPASSPASSPTTINSSPRSSTGPDNDEAASVALAQYLQQQENIAAYEEYSARLLAADTNRGSTASLNQYAYGNSSHGSSASLAGREIDPDNMTYDELLQLGEENGDVRKERWRQMAVQVISCLPTHRWSGSNTSDLSCIICQYTFAQGDRALTLPCAHVFHEECVDGWIRENNSCPLCKLEIVQM